MKIVKNFQLKIVIFTVMKNRCILHGHVSVMLFQGMAGIVLKSKHGSYRAQEF